MYAVSSASVAWAVTRSCSKGELNDCSCDNRVRKKTPRNWQWGGCSEVLQSYLTIFIAKTYMYLVYCF